MHQRQQRCGKTILQMETAVEDDKQGKIIEIPDITPPLRPQRPRKAKIKVKSKELTKKLGKNCPFCTVKGRLERGKLGV